QVGDEHALAVRREFQAIGALGPEVQRLFDLFSSDIDDGYAAVARVRSPELFFIGRNVDSLWPFANRNDCFIPTLRSGALNQCDGIRADIRREDPVPILADQNHVRSSTVSQLIRAS